MSAATACCFPRDSLLRPCHCLCRSLYCSCRYCRSLLPFAAAIRCCHCSCRCSHRLPPGSSTVSMFDCHLFAPNPITSNSTLSRFPRPGLWALNNGGDMVVDVFKNDMSAFDEELRMTR